MRLISLSFYNINSLKASAEAPFYFRFDKGPLYNAGLFSITGLTGAGKSTILDAITLALYGQAARFDKDGTTNYNVLTTGQKDAASELVFEVNNTKYRAVWKLSRKKKQKKLTGFEKESELYDKHQRLIEHDTGIVLTQKAAPFKKEIEKLVQLSYTEFTRSVILAQGKFTKFLKANYNERAEILRKITGVNIYHNLGEFLKNKIKAEEDNIQDCNAKLKALKILTTEEVQTLQQNLSQQKTAVKEAQLVIENAQSSLQKHKAINDAQIEYQTALNNLAALQNQATKIAAIQSRINAHNKGIPFYEKLSSLKQLQKKQQELKEQISQVSISQQAVSNQVSKLQTQQQSLQAAIAEAQHHTQIEQKGIDQVKRLQTQIEEKSQQLQKSQNAANKLTAQYQHVSQQLIQAKSILESLHTQKATLNSWLQQHAYAQNINPDALSIALNQYTAAYQTAIRTKNNLKAVVDASNKSTQDVEQISQQLNKTTQQATSLQEKIKKLKAKLNLISASNIEQLNSQIDHLSQKQSKGTADVENAKQYNKHLQEKNQLQQELHTLQIQLQTQQEVVNKHQQQLQQAKEIENLAQQSYQQEKIILDNQSLIAELQNRLIQKPGSACTVCGATHHPYLSHATKPVPTAAIQGNTKLKTYQIKTETATKQLEKSTALANQITTKIHNSTFKIKSFNEEIQRLQKQIQLPKPIEQGLYNISNLEQKQATLQQNIQHLQQLRKDVQNLSNLQSTITILNQKLTDSKHLRNKNQQEKNRLLTEHQTQQKAVDTQKANLQQKLQGLPFSLPNTPTTENTNQLIQQLQHTHQAYQTKQANNTSLAENIKLQQQDIENIQTQKTNAQGQALAAQKEVEQLNKALQQLKSQKENLTSHWTHTQPEAYQKSLQTILQQKTEALAKNQKSTNQLQGELKTLSKQQQQLQNNIQKATTASQTQEQNLLKAITKQGISTIANLQQQQLQQAELRDLNHTLSTYNSKQQSAKDHIQRSKIKKQQAQAQAPQQSPAELQAQIKQQKQASHQLQKQIIELNTQLLKHQETLEQNQALAQQSERHNKEKQKWQQLENVISPGNKGNTFDHYAQSLSLAKLIQLANKHLKVLKPRYIIEQGRGQNYKELLNLYIIDTQNAHTRRPINSLSGGETFLVSLSLALALSDLAGKNNPINALFIDEGFSTLDNHTLSIALDTLNTLRSKGKTIGVISHVQYLKEAIPINVEVNSTSTNQSTITINGKALHQHFGYPTTQASTQTKH